VRALFPLALTCAVACGPATTATSPPATARPTQPLPAPSPTAPPPAPTPLPVIVITAPLPDAPLPNPFTLAGQVGRLPADSALRYRLRSLDGEDLADGQWIIPESPATFSMTVSYTMTLPGPAELEVRIADTTIRQPVRIPALTVHLLSGLRLTINGLASKARAEIVPGRPHVRSPLEWNGWPEHMRVVFDDDAPPNDNFDPRQRQLLVLPLASYRALFRSADAEAFDAALRDLQALLAAQPTRFEQDMLLLPASGLSQAIWAQVRYLSFEGGRGVRFVTRLATELGLLTAGSLTYTFQGLTEDGRYYIAAYFPITTTLLPSKPAEVDKPTRELFRRDYRAYAEGIAQQLDAHPESFTPALRVLDGLIASLAITDELLGAQTVPSDVPAGEAKTLLNVRAGPGTRFRIIGQLAPGQRVELLARDAAASWLRVRAPGGMIGWVSRAYVDSPFDLELLPVQQP